MVTLQDFAATDLDYVAKLNANNAALLSAINALEAQVTATFGDGSQLILDLWDRDGIVGAHSYQLDIEAYTGGASITIGRRPAPVVIFGEEDISIAWATFGGIRARVTLTGDLLMTAAAIVSGLPKDVFIGVASDGTPQFFEDTVTPNVLYIYKMCWDGFQLSDFQRIGHILPAYSTLQEMMKAVRQITIFDGETDWVSEAFGETEIVLPGQSASNEINVDGSVEVVGFFVSAAKLGDDGFNAPVASSDPEDPKVKLKVVSEAVTWSKTDFDIDAGAIPDAQFREVDLIAVGTDRFVTEFRRFSLERVSVGPSVTSARAFSWGLYVIPILGTPIAKDPTGPSGVIQI